jgi:hypothetical protein
VAGTDRYEAPCVTVAKLLGDDDHEPGYLPTGCCWSCHEDGDTFEIEIDGRELFGICCAWANRWLDR